MPSRTFAIVNCVLLLLILMGCSSKRKLVEKGVSLNASEKSVVRNLTNNTLVATELQAKVKCRFKNPDSSVRFTAKLRWKKDEAIWVSATFLGIEAARILMKPDSVWIINKLERSYVADSFEELLASYDIEGLSFEHLQYLILGGDPFPDEEIAVFNAEAPYYTLVKTLGNEISATYALEADPIKIHQIDINDPKRNFDIEAKYLGYEELRKAEFPYIRQYITKNNNVKDSQIQLEFANVAFEKDKSMPFHIPSNYSAWE